MMIYCSYKQWGLCYWYPIDGKLKLNTLLLTLKDIKLVHNLQ